MFGPFFMQMYETMGSLCAGFYETFGDEALPIINKVAEVSGKKSGEIMKGMIKSKDMKGVAEMFKMWEMMGMEYEITDLSDDTLHFKTSKCVPGLENTSKELCKAMMNNDRSMVSTLLGKEVKIEIPKSLAAGDEYCEVVFTTI